VYLVTPPHLEVSGLQQVASQEAAVVADEEQYKPVTGHFFLLPGLQLPALHDALAVQQSEFLVAVVVCVEYLAVST
jgi:hypothetical protein